MSIIPGGGGVGHTTTTTTTVSSKIRGGESNQMTSSDCLAQLKKNSKIISHTMSEQLTFENIALGSTVLTAVLASILKLNPGWKKSKGGGEKLGNGKLDGSVQRNVTALGTRIGFSFHHVDMSYGIDACAVYSSGASRFASGYAHACEGFYVQPLERSQASIVATFEWTMSKYGDQIVPAGILVAKWWLLQAALMIFLPGPSTRVLRLKMDMFPFIRTTD